jgi:hypothetical protein
MNDGHIMDCSGINQRLDDYLDGAVSADDIVAIERHADACPACRALLTWEIRVHRALRELPAPEPTEEFFDRAFARVVAQTPSRRNWRIPGLALAASILLIFTVNLLLESGTAPVEEIPGLAIALNQIHEVSLVFESERAMHNARFTIELPEGIELSGYPGQREISWEGNLAQGRNLLVLPVEARSGQGGKLVAYVTHTGKRKNLVLRMEVIPPTAPPAVTQGQHAAPVTVM